MNAAQMKYLFLQLDHIERDLFRKIEENYHDSPNFEEKVEMIRNGEVPLRPLAALKSYTDLIDAYDFTGKVVDLSETRNKKRESLKDRIQHIKNAVVFDGQTTAQEMLAGAKTISIEEL